MRCIKHIIVVLLIIIATADCFAQTLSVDGIRALPNDLSASVYQRKDLNGQACALIKVAFPKAGVAFEGSVIGTTEYKVGEYWVYLTANSKFLKMKHAEYIPLMIRFDERTVGPVESKKVYGVKVSATSAQSVTPMVGQCVYGELTIGGNKYIGYHRNGKPHGKGVYIWSNGARYEGDFIDDKMTGKGVYIWPNGERYEGDFTDDKRTGKGIYSWPDGHKYEGDFIDNKRTGKGVYIWPNGDKYEGDFIDDRRTGKGVYIWPDGERYEGEFVNGNFEGKGTRKYMDGSIYTGDWKNNKRNGWGVLTWPNGGKYEGNFIDDEMTGK